MLQDFSENTWGNLKDEWALALEEYSDYGKKPLTTVDGQLIEIGEDLDASLNDENSKIIKILAFREAVYLFYKACSVLHSLQRDLESKKQTYAEVSGYISSFFSSRALVIILGFFYSEITVNNKSWSIFLFNREEGIDRTAVRLVPRRKGSKVGHSMFWGIYKEIFQKVNGLPFGASFFELVSGLEIGDFSEYRNNIQYRNCEWKYEDLHFNEFLNLDLNFDFSKVQYSSYKDCESSCFTIFFALISIRKFMLLFFSLSENCTFLRGERDLMTENIKSLGFLKGSTWLPE